MDTRHKNAWKPSRIFLRILLTNVASLPYPNDLTQHIIDNITEIDKSIASLAIKFPIDKIAKIDLAILRLAVYELAIAPMNQ